MDNDKLASRAAGVLVMAIGLLIALYGLHGLIERGAYHWARSRGEILA